MNPVIIFGANPLGRVAREIFESNKVEVYGFLDDDTKLHNTELDEAMVLGSTDNESFLKLVGKKCDAFIALDDNKLRKGLVKLLQEERRTQPVNAIHASASLSPRAELGHGNFMDQGTIVAVGARIGSHCLLHASVIIGAGSTVGDFVQVGAGSVVNPGVTIEDEVFIGTGAVVVSGVTIGKGARIGAGSVVVGAVKSGETVFGNPAVKIKS